MKRLIQLKREDILPGHIRTMNKNDEFLICWDMKGIENSVPYFTYLTERDITVELMSMN